LYNPRAVIDGALCSSFLVQHVHITKRYRL
jgi:hypothetical protein